MLSCEYFRYSSLLKPSQHRMTQLEKTVVKLSADLEQLEKTVVKLSADLEAMKQLEVPPPDLRVHTAASASVLLLLLLTTVIVSHNPCSFC